MKRPVRISCLGVSMFSAVAVLLLMAVPAMAQLKMLQTMPTKTQDYVIGAWEIYKFAGPYGFRSYIAPSTGTCDAPHGLMGNKGLFANGGSKLPVGTASCNYHFFSGGQLKEGWSFKSYDMKFTSNNHCTLGKDCMVTTMMKTYPGTRSIYFYMKIDSKKYNGFAQFHLYSITLTGPAGKDWRDAFR